MEVVASAPTLIDSKPWDIPNAIRSIVPKVEALGMERVPSSRINVDAHRVWQAWVWALHLSG